MKRSYDVRPKTTVTVSEAGEVTVEVDLVNLPWQMENDCLSEHTGVDLMQDVESVREALMASPFNHTITTTLSN